MPHNLTTQQNPALTGTVSSLSTTTALMNTKKDAIISDGQMRGLDGKKRE
jgi:hypothetical protein